LGLPFGWSHSVDRVASGDDEEGSVASVESDAQFWERWREEQLREGRGGSDSDNSRKARPEPEAEDEISPGRAAHGPVVAKQLPSGPPPPKVSPPKPKPPVPAKPAPKVLAPSRAGSSTDGGPAAKVKAGSPLPGGGRFRFYTIPNADLGDPGVYRGKETVERYFKAPYTWSPLSGRDFTAIRGFNDLEDACDAFEQQFPGQIGCTVLWA
jgi:hypothetical protein